MIRTRLLVCAASALVYAMLASSGWGAYVKDLKDAEDFRVGVHERAVFLPEFGGLGLPRGLYCIPSLWIPSPTNNIVSKIDARTGREVGRFRIGPPEGEWSPCAVASDLGGNAYIACSAQGRMGRVVRISALAEQLPGRILPWGEDRSVGPVIDLGVGSEPSALAFDESGALWVALAGGCALARVDPVAGAITARIPLPARPSALVADGPRHSMWVVSRQGSVLCRIDTLTATLAESHSLGTSSPTAMCIDHSGRIWIANEYDGLITYQPNGRVWDRLAADYGGGFTGIACDSDGDIWAACPVKTEVTHFSALDGSIIIAIPVGKSPGAVSVDAEGFVWVLNQDSDTVTRIDPREDKKTFAAATCGMPYTSTPFASAIQYRGICADGSWRYVLDSGIQAGLWGRIEWQADQRGGRIAIEVRSAETREELGSRQFVRANNGDEFAVPQGRYLELKVCLTSNGRTSPLLRSVHIESADDDEERGSGEKPVILGIR